MKLINSRLKEAVGTVEIDVALGTKYLYLPISLKGSPEITLPLDIRYNTGLLAMIFNCLQSFGDIENKYVYLSLERSMVAKGKTQKRPGFHCDGYLTEDSNFLWANTLPTQFLLGNYIVYGNHHDTSLFDIYAKENIGNIYPAGIKEIIRTGPTDIHAATKNTHFKEVDRTFAKISISDDRYNLKGNSINTELEYDWKMYDREAVRNHPQYKEKDFIK